MRRKVPEGDVPAKLATFTASDWPGATAAAKVAAWKAARLAYCQEWGWPGGPLEALLGALDVQYRLEGRPLPLWRRPPP